MISTPLRLRRAYLAVPLLLTAALALGFAATESAAQPASPGASTSFRVGGQVAHRNMYRLEDLRNLQPHTVTVSFEGPGGLQTHTFTGALLYDVATAAEPRFHTDRKNDPLRWTARVHATDNYEVVVAWGEFDPGFENKPVLLAYEDNGALLTTTGFARLVVPNDNRGGRYVSNVDLVAFNPPLLGPGPDFPFPLLGGF